MAITTHPDARARVTQNLLLQAYVSKLYHTAGCQLGIFSEIQRQHGFLGDSDFFTVENHITDPAERPTFP